MDNKILLVEDDIDISNNIKTFLSLNGFKVVQAFSAGDTFDIFDEKEISLIILDLMLPDMFGSEILKVLRARGIKIPILVLSALSEEHNKVSLLELGADDYLTKPFGMKELLARIKSLIRRKDGFGLVAEKGPFRVDREKSQIHFHGNLMNLTATEYKLLLFLFENSGRTFSREKLIDKVWGEEYFVEARMVDVYIRRLREKIEADPSNPQILKTRRGFGYVLEI
ncbi:MAG TPA: response regulator transcription factor [Thermodesulfobium narugense]|uniref:Phosphate regulon transcriptional regulatory protein PhoB n=1 Tax=Thermodesulfobium acidiphilum TaxID=1794699 RepID=A0A2R4VYN8_THEAF|nr:response regulator transcription factor [Thermodesulfobium acidiphilum]AWB09560.1 two-component system, OmpR family, response regulator RegX3 [Thermodesulfobium acidiphilum]PMP85740.1 MAG: DNA-binding response regulator [Thermodesulfobium narugense]HEM55922.1 response regulator transcription factor [Thermodesulfobium narugense]